MQNAAPDFSKIPAPKRVLSEEETGKLYIESMIALPVILQAVLEQLEDATASLSVISLYFEKKGFDEKLFAPDELTNE